MSDIDISELERVAILTLKRPGYGNRITQGMAEELIAALDSARRNPDILGCVLTGHGDVFCLGGDYQGAGPRISGRMEFGRAHIDLFDAMARLGKPLVAALNGNAHAGGFAVMIGCDLAFAEEGATFGLPEIARGLFSAGMPQDSSKPCAAGRLSGLEVVFARDLMLKVDRKRADCPNSFRSTWTRRATASEGEVRSSSTRSGDCSSHQTRCAHLFVNSPGSAAQCRRAQRFVAGKSRCVVLGPEMKEE